MSLGVELNKLTLNLVMEEGGGMFLLKFVHPQRMSLHIDIMNIKSWDDERFVPMHDTLNSFNIVGYINFQPMLIF
jgi:hypothetical protein